MMIHTSNRVELSDEQKIARFEADKERRASYMRKNNELKTKLVQFYRAYNGKCAELDEFLAQ